MYATDAFELRSGRVSIGDAVMRFARYELPLACGLYRLQPGSLTAIPKGTPRHEVIDLDSAYLYVVDSVVQSRFESLFHEIASPLHYAMVDVLERHSELEAALGLRVGFYWLADVRKEGAPTNTGRYHLDLTLIRPVPDNQAA